jgi:hypothetical protein
MRLFGFAPCSVRCVFAVMGKLVAAADELEMALILGQRIVTPVPQRAQVISVN